MKARTISRRRFIGGVCFAGIGTGLAAGYSRFVEAESLEQNSHDIQLDRAGQTPIRLLHLSDLHASAVVSLNYLNHAIDLSLEWRPDLICITGDFITRHFETAAAYAAALRRLAMAAPTFACLGNHDGGRWSGNHGGHPDLRWITRLLNESGVELLLNQSRVLTVQGRSFHMVGVGDLWSGHFDPVAAFAFPTRADSSTILLSHNPDTKARLHGFAWDLMLCGHTHGGQLKLPLIGTPFAPVLDKRFVAGLHSWRQRWIHVTKGVGSIFGLRINCPPEISRLTLA